MDSILWFSKALKEGEKNHQHPKPLQPPRPVHAGWVRQRQFAVMKAVPRLHVPGWQAGPRHRAEHGNRPGRNEPKLLICT